MTDPNTIQLKRIRLVKFETRHVAYPEDGGSDQTFDQWVNPAEITSAYVACGSAFLALRGGQKLRHSVMPPGNVWPRDAPEHADVVAWRWLESWLETAGVDLA